MCVYLRVCVCLDVHMDLNCMVLKPQEIIVGLVLPPDLKVKIIKFKVIVMAREKIMEMFDY